jgi:hypothetical protein
MKHTFNREEVLKLVAITKAATKCHVPYTGKAWKTPEKTDPGLELVGDDGVYLMSNACDQKRDAQGACALAYANEVNPKKLEFSVWWEAKRCGFGGDDGVNFLPLAEIEKWIAASTGPLLSMDISAKSIVLLS